MAKAQTPQVNVSEQTPLLEAQAVRDPLPESSQGEAAVEGKGNNGHLWALCPLFIGVFVANADTSLVLATYTTISSEFSNLRNASWLLTAYMLAMSGTQPLYGKLSNIFGRKALLIIAYVLFAIGNAICGAAPTMNVAIAGRFIAGTGGAGMTSVVSYVIADLMPVRDIATYRSYVNIVTTLGRSCGGPLGGKLTEMVGWRWTFLSQVPPTLVAILLVSRFLSSTTTAGEETRSERKIVAQIRRIDFSGSFLLCAGIILFLIPITMGGNQLPWVHPVTISLFVCGCVSAALFVLVESRWATEPVFPLGLLKRWEIVAPFCIMLLQSMAQILMMYTIPLYFQVTANASPSVSGYYLVPAVFGNTVGGLWTAARIKKSGRFKRPTVLAAVLAGLCHTLILLRWNGSTSPLEALYVMLGGFGTGVAHSSTFIAVMAATTEEELAIAGGGLYLCSGLGAVLGVAAAESTTRAMFKRELTRRLGSSDDTARIIENLLRDIKYLGKMPEATRAAAVAAYITGFKCDFGVSLICCMVSLVLGLMMRNLRLPA